VVGSSRRRVHPLRLRARHHPRLPVPVVRRERLFERQHELALSVRSRSRLPRGVPRLARHGVGGHRRVPIRLWAPARGATPLRAAAGVDEVRGAVRAPLRRRPRLVALQRHGGGVLSRDLGRRAPRGARIDGAARERTGGSTIHLRRLGARPVGAHPGRHETRRRNLDRGPRLDGRGRGEAKSGEERGARGPRARRRTRSRRSSSRRSPTDGSRGSSPRAEPS
jgi:hypothetical protein